MKLVFRPTQSFPCAPRGQCADRWIGYIGYRGQDCGRLDGIGTPALLAVARVRSILGPACRWFRGTDALHVPVGDDRAR